MATLGRGRGRALFGRAPRASRLDEALLAAVTDAVPPGSASLQRAWSRDAGAWFVAVVPVNPDACAFSVGAHGNGQVRFTLGSGTSFELYGVWRERQLGLTKRLLAGIVAGRITEFGRGRRAYVEIGLVRGVYSSGPRRWLPLPPLRLPGRRYAPFAQPPAAG